MSSYTDDFATMEDDRVDMYSGEGERSASFTDSSTTSAEDTRLQRFLEEVNLAQHYEEKLSLSTILQIDTNATTNDSVKSKTDVARSFLKRLMMTNVTARNVNCVSVSDPGSSEASTALNIDDLLDSSNSETLNPVDIVTALFLCSDGLVQQELSLKMSVCQFAVPLLLPDCDTNQCTLMLWALRDIVKKYRPKSLSETKGFKEERIVHSQIPVISFVRLGDCSLSKSKTLNLLLSNSQQYHDTFVHRDMEGGDCPLTISNGLAEITWYLPCGNKNIDIFDEPVAVVNLRGDITSLETQYAFLCQISSAVFVFFDNFSLDYSLLRETQQKEKIHLVIDQKNRVFNPEKLKTAARDLGLTNNRILLKKKAKNEADFVKVLRDSLNNVIENTTSKTPLENMVYVAENLGILVDENRSECQEAKEKAFALTGEINDIPKFKESELPLQGQIWMDLTLLEKEEFRLRKIGTEGIEQYKCSLQAQRQELRKKQISHERTNAMSCFIDAISSPGLERSYFLQWMRMNLDNLSHEKLSDLRKQFKSKCKDSENKEEITKIDQELSNSSLGTEHFFREIGQMYEASVSLPETHPSRQELQKLPRLCAQLLLDGFPLELVDGDTANIPLRWVSDVLGQLHELVSPNNKILVVTVLGVQGTGKSTLLNTMFGVKFAVSSGRCTRGAFMLLIKVSEEMKTSLSCDFLVILDTEGLKSPELATLDHSNAHDNELATLVVGLSDITIINIAMENSTEMKDILQIVVHAFLRMKEIGKKPKCQFVHQNVSDVSAREKNLRDRKLLLQQLNEMTQAAAKMERREENKSFTDVMDYDPDTGNWYIPGLWNGNPPMAPVNAGYSEAVYELKKNVVHILENHASTANDILQFCEWIKSLWTAVKHENFIFSFRNSLVADAYMRLCTEFNKWELEFQKDMYTWKTNAETNIKNFGTVALASQKHQNIEELLTDIKEEARSKVSEWETKILRNLAEYFKQKEGNVELVEGHKQEFENSTKSLGKVLEASLFKDLTIAADMTRGQAELDRVKEKHTKEIGDRVCELIENCRKKHAEMTDQELDREFDDMWKKALKKLELHKQTPSDIFANVTSHLRCNMKDKGSHACQELSKKSLKDCGLEPLTYTAEGWGKLAKHRFYKWIKHEDNIETAQRFADRIITVCQELVTEKMERKNNYHKTFILEILHIIDTELSNDKINDMDFEVCLKQHICATAARQFQKMHEDFLSENDPSQCLNKNKEKFRGDFKDIFNERDLCHKKAMEFTDKCLKVSIQDFISRYLGLDIVGKMLTCPEFRTRMEFQYNVLLDLLENNIFFYYLEYTTNYEGFVKAWITDKIYEHSSAISEFEKNHIQSCVRSIEEAITKAKGDSENVKSLVEKICQELGKKLVISKEAVDTFMVLNNTDKETFVFWLIKCVKEMGESLQNKLEVDKEKDKKEMEKKLRSLHVKPQNELFKRIIGCGKTCPFCDAPCDAGGAKHSEHWTSLHRPQALAGYRYSESNKLNTDICSSAVNSNICFKSPATKGKWRYYKTYREVYPDWKITADVSLEASDYWKYVLTKCNNKFAEIHNAEPADIPESWNSINKDKAKESIKESFNIK